jgi:hypothetical protein
MPRSLLVLLLVLFMSALQAHSARANLLHKFSATSAEGSWLWGWVWGAESSVSIVDRSPPLTFHSRPAAFGPQLEDPLLGYVIPLSSFTSPCLRNDALSGHSTSNSGCSPLCPVGPYHPDPKESWIALVQRGHCPFVDKACQPHLLARGVLLFYHQVREAQRLGARAVVVGGEDPEISGLPDALVNMYSKGSFHPPSSKTILIPKPTR